MKERLRKSQENFLVQNMSSRLKCWPEEGARELLTMDSKEAFTLLRTPAKLLISVLQ